MDTVAAMDRLEFNQQVIDEFRANEGRVGGPFEGAPMLLLTTTGAKSGRRLTSPLVYSKDGDDIIVIASKAGAPTNPDWFHNLKANPAVTVEVGTTQLEARAEITEGAERDRLFDAQAELMPNFKEYAAATDRVIPVVRLRSAHG
jgi:deazaflavin-dependent oxidoreductase (nitroreductase family)